MLTPNDIQNAVFDTSFRGYKKEDVDAFLDRLTLDYQSVIDENLKLRKQIDEQNKKLDQARRAETSVMNTMEQAKRLMSDITESAEKRAEVIIKNARLDAATINRNAKDEVAAMQKDTANMRNRLENFRAKYRSFLNEEMEYLDGNVDDLFRDLDENYAIANAPEAAAVSEETDGEPAPAGTDAAGAVDEAGAEETGDGTPMTPADPAEITDGAASETADAALQDAQAAEDLGAEPDTPAGAADAPKRDPEDALFDEPDDEPALTTDDLLSELPDAEPAGGEAASESAPAEPSAADMVRESVSRDTLIFRQPSAQQITEKAEEVYGKAGDFDTTAADDIVAQIDRELEKSKTRNLSSLQPSGQSFDDRAKTIVINEEDFLRQKQR